MSRQPSWPCSFPSCKPTLVLPHALHPLTHPPFTSSQIVLHEQAALMAMLLSIVQAYSESHTSPPPASISGSRRGSGSDYGGNTHARRKSGSNTRSGSNSDSWGGEVSPEMSSEKAQATCTEDRKGRGGGRGAYVSPGAQLRADLLESATLALQVKLVMCVCSCVCVCKCMSKRLDLIFTGSYLCLMALLFPPAQTQNRQHSLGCCYLHTHTHIHTRTQKHTPVSYVELHAAICTHTHTQTHTYTHAHRSTHL